VFACIRKSGNGSKAISRASINHQKEPEGFSSHLLMNSVPANFSTKNKNKHHSIRITGTKAHLPIIPPATKATIKLIRMMRKGDVRTIRCLWLKFIFEVLAVSRAYWNYKLMQYMNLAYIIAYYSLLKYKGLLNYN